MTTNTVRLAHANGLTHRLQIGQTLVCTADANSSGYALQIETNPGEAASNTRTNIPAGGATTIGPFVDTRNFRVIVSAGALSVNVPV